MKKAILYLVPVVLFAGLSFAQTTDPSLVDYQLQISCSGGGCSTGIGTGSIAGEVNGISGNTVTILENGNGSPAVLDPVLLILGVPNPQPSGFTAPLVTAINGTSVTPFGPGLAGGAWGWSGSSSATIFNSTNGASAYSAVGLNNAAAKTGQNSENFGNWQTANAQLGLTTNSFSLYVYAIPGTGLTGGHTASVTFSNLPFGTFIIATSCSTGSNTSSCTTQGDELGATPFTVSGEETSHRVSEAPVLGMLALSGIAGLVGIRVRKRRS